MSVLLLALLFCTAQPDAGIFKTTLATRWVGLRVWYTTQLTLQQAGKAETPRLFAHRAKAPRFERSFPADLIQPRV